MDGRRHAPIGTFFSAEPIAAGRPIVLSDDAAHHARVRRMQPGDAVRITTGRGAIGHGTIERLTKSSAVVRIEDCRETLPPSRLELFVPVADKERMLWLAEKCTELAVSVWQPVLFRRSSSVSPRGEGERFLEKVRTRMISALEQSGGAWLPEIGSEMPLDEALVRASATQEGHFFLERGGLSLLAQKPHAARAMIGPEGGIDDEERALIVEKHGWLPVSLADTTLRFETAGVVAAGILRALMANV